jgi:precorrin-2/cobalt-factor-2 C20-methyltransferase
MMTSTTNSGVLHIVGLGPGDPDLMTVKAARVLQTCPVMVFFAKHGRPGHARTQVEGRFRPDAEIVRLNYPFTEEVAVDDPRYLAEMGEFYDACAETLAERLAAGKDVALICEGDPFFYGSSMYLHDRLKTRFPVTVIPGVTGMAGAAAAVGLPLCHGDDRLVVLPGTLSEPELVSRMREAEALVVMKVGRNLAKLRRALETVGLADRAIVAERATHADQRLTPLRDYRDERAPYFTLILVPGRRGVR